MRRSIRLWLILSLTVLFVLVGCETTRPNTEDPLEGQQEGVAAQTEGTPTDGVVTDGTATDGTATDGTATDGTTTDGTTTDGTATDGTATDGGEQPTGDATTVAVDGAEGGEAPAEQPSGEAQVYAVQAGDTLQSIADQFGTTVEEIRANNNLESDFLTVGQELVVGGAPGGEVQAQAEGGEPAAEGEAPAEAAAPAEAGAPAEGGEATTDSGEAQADTSAASEGAADAAPQTGPIIHTVQAGEWVYAIARQYGVSPQAIIAANPGINPDRLRPGQQLTIPTGGGGDAPPSSGDTSVHVVQRGDTLYSLARRYGTTVAALRQANRLGGDTIYVGQRLVIP